MVATSARRASILEQLQGHRMFGVLPKTVLTDLAAEGIERAFVRGSHLYFARDPLMYMYLLTSGLVAMTRLGDRGNSHSLLTFTAGDVLGLAAIMLDRHWTVDAVAVTSTKAILLPLDGFHAAYRHCPEFAHRVARELAHMFLRSQEVSTRLSQIPVASRVAKYLVDLADAATASADGGRVVDLGLSYYNLGLLLGTTRETVSRSLARLSRSGLVAVSGRKVDVLRPEALRSLADG